MPNAKAMLPNVINILLRNSCGLDFWAMSLSGWHRVASLLLAKRSYKLRFISLFFRLCSFMFTIEESKQDAGSADGVKELALPRTICMRW